MNVLFPVSIISWKMTQSAFRFYYMLEESINVRLDEVLTNIKELG